MTARCPVDWVTDIDDIDGDGEGEHACIRDEGHTDDWHYCAYHFACAPVYGTPAEFADEDAGSAADGVS